MKLTDVLLREAKKVILQHAKSLVRHATNVGIETTKQAVQDYVRERKQSRSGETHPRQKIVSFPTLNIIDEDDSSPAPSAKRRKRRPKRRD